MSSDRALHELGIGDRAWSRVILWSGLKLVRATRVN